MTALFEMLSMSSGAGGTDGVDHGIILVREDGAQIEFESAIGDVADDGWSESAHARGEFVCGTIVRLNVDADGRYGRAGQSAAAGFYCAATDVDSSGQAAQSRDDVRGAGAQFIFRSFRHCEDRNVAG